MNVIPYGNWDVGEVGSHANSSFALKIAESPLRKEMTWRDHL